MTGSLLIAALWRGGEFTDMATRSGRHDTRSADEDLLDDSVGDTFGSIRSSRPCLNNERQRRSRKPTPKYGWTEMQNWRMLVFRKI
jgi:hypothetical protein